MATLGDDAADVASSASCSSTRTSWPARGGLHRRARRVSEARARRRVRQGDADARVRSARHEVDDVRLREGAARQSRVAARHRHRRQAGARRHGGELLDHPGAPGRRGVEQRRRRAEVRRAWSSPRASCRTASSTSRRRRCSRGAMPQVAIGEDATYGMGLDGPHEVRRHRRPSRRRHDRLPQRHDVAPRARTSAP